jgi:hypothetical protein
MKTVYQDSTTPGTVVTAEALNALQNHRHDGLDQDGSCPIDYAIATGSNNNYVLTLTPALDAYINGLPFYFKANHTSTGPATLNISGLGAKTLKKNFNQDIAADDIQSGQIIMGVYDGTYIQIFLMKNSYFYGSDTGAANAYAVSYAPPLTAHVVGVPLRFKAAHGNTGASTVAINALSAVSIRRLDGTQLLEGDIPAGSMITVIYDGTYYQLQAATTNNVSSFPNLLATNGYQKLPGGLILQWGQYASVMAPSKISVTFPLAFPTACLNVTATTIDHPTIETDMYAIISSFTKTEALIWAWGINSSDRANGIYWFAIGY